MLEEEAAELAARYINDRHLPDKAIDVIDEAGAWNVAAVVYAAITGDDDADLGVGEMGLKPGGRDDRLNARGREKRKNMQHVSSFWLL